MTKFPKNDSRRSIWHWVTPGSLPNHVATTIYGTRPKRAMLKIRVCTSPPYVLLQKVDQTLPRNIVIDRHEAQMGGLDLGAVVAQRRGPSFRLLETMLSLRCNHPNSIDERA